MSVWAGEPAMGAWALIEMVAEREGRELWFKQMTAIGPMTTPDPAERALFHTEQDARQSPAMGHPIALFEPREIAA